MDTAIAVALISLFGTLCGTFGGIYVSSKLTIYRIEQLEKKMDRFEHIEERLYNLEAHDKIQDTRADNIESDVSRIDKRGEH